MTAYAVAPTDRPAAPIKGADALFPIRRLYCVGRNYAAHAVEMGHDPDQEPPFFFQKNPDDADFTGAFPYPSGSEDVHHEVELAVALKSGGVDIAPEAALDHVFGYGVALDMTRRDLQATCKKAGRPWEVAKAFERSAPMSAITPAAEIGHPSSGRISLHVDGALRQDGDLNQMIWKTPDIISYLSSLFRLDAGDVILTGTPAGVGPVRPGQSMTAEIASVGALTVLVKERGV